MMVLRRTLGILSIIVSCWTLIPLTTFLCLDLSVAAARASEHLPRVASAAAIPSYSTVNKQHSGVHSRAELDAVLKDTIKEVRKVLVTRTEKFDEFFRELLKNSKRDFHHMFLQTYGLLYEKNSYIFTDMFADLEKYYATGGVDLNEALDGFFQRLYQKMFQVLNGQYSFDDNYLQCVGKHMDELKPFGDIPKKLKIEVKRSFVATRTFVQALSNGKDVLNNIIEVSPSFDCSKSLMKMTYCPHCQGSTELKPCTSLCSGVMRTCLAVHVELNKEWNNYIDALVLLSSRLETSFNIESVVDPIDIKISEAIMNFQENGIIVSQKLFEKCGKPRIGKRAAVTDRHNGEDLMDNGFDDFNTYRSHQQPHSSRMVAAGTSMDRLIQDIKRKIRRTKDFWAKLPATMCANKAFGGVGLGTDGSGSGSATAGSTPSREPSKSCWNGTDIVQKDLDKFDIHDNDSSSKTQHSNGHKHAPRQNAVISQQILTLKLITTKVNYAYNGLEVEWQDNGGDADHVSGSGSGSGPDDSDAEEDAAPSYPVHGKPGGSGQDTSDIYFGPASTDASSSPSNSFVTQVPNTRYPAKSTRFPNRINVIYNIRQRGANHASSMTNVSLSVCNFLLLCTTMLFATTTMLS